MDDKKSKIVTIVLIVVIVAIVAILGYLAYTAFADKKKEETYINAANEFEKSVTASSSRSSGGNATLNAIDIEDGTNKKYMEEYEVIGTIEIPKIELKCAILDQVTTRSIEIAVAQMYTNNGLNQAGNTVIYGHNYRNKLFFSRNDELEKGDEIKILDKTGTKKTYEIFDIFETTMTDTTFYNRTSEMTGGKAEVTLSTCTDDAATTDRRLIIQASEK